MGYLLWIYGNLDSTCFLVYLSLHAYFHFLNLNTNYLNNEHCYSLTIELGKLGKQTELWCILFNSRNCPAVAEDVPKECDSEDALQLQSSKMRI